MGTRAIRELPLAASLLLLAAAVFHGEAAGDGMVPWLAAGALAALVLLAALDGIPHGFVALLPLAALTAWLALSISWSALPDRSWDYADRTFLYLLFAAVGLWLGGRTRQLALGLCALLGAVVLWSLGSKVFPVGAEPVIGVRSRLDTPVGLWNQLALLGDFALPLALWLAGRLRILGTLLAYAWGVAIVLTLSRGGLAVAAVVVVAWIALDDERADALVTVVAAGLPAAGVAGLAFALPGVTGENPSSATRWHDGLLFGLALLAGGALAAALSQLPRPRSSTVLRRVLVVAAALAIAALVVGALVKGPAAWRQFTASGSVANQGARASLSSNLRWTWWRQAWHGFADHPALGTGAGSFNVTNLRYRTSYLDYTIEPHDLPVQFLSEAGAVGLALFALVAFALVRPGFRRRRYELALALIPVAYLLHGLVDIDWDFVAVSAPAFLVGGALAGRPSERRVGGFATLLAAGAAAVAFCVLLLPWLGERWADAAFVADTPAQATKLANRARAVDPLLVEPYWALAAAAEERRRYANARNYYRLATERQPQNAETWLLSAEFELRHGCARHALAAFYRFNALDRYAAPSDGPAEYLHALKLVNSGKPLC
ncbi:MAG TPA: O-antigen ligase family protein [Gaiellaceae bacterium]|nr:O-antigen ligase family protein [Gaiellaceae bacterium]